MTPEQIEQEEYERQYWPLSRRPNPRICPTLLAGVWEAWCGDTAWSKAMMDFAEAGGLVVDWGGRPQSRSATPLTFALYLPDGSQFPCKYRLRDIKAATAAARAMGRVECPE